jgi:hypothetical protein
MAKRENETDSSHARQDEQVSAVAADEWPLPETVI